MNSINFEVIAAKIHEFYFAKYGGFLPAHYAELPEFMKADNRAAARRIETVLAIAGLRLESRNGVAWPTEEQQKIRAIMEENIHNLAEAEHDGWLETRRRQGWIPAPKPQTDEERQANFDQRGHHLLIPYADLLVAEQKKDQDVRNYVEIIGQTDYRIVVR